MTKLSWHDPGKTPQAARFGLAGSADGAVFTLGSLLCPLLGSPGTVLCRGWEELTSVRSVSLVWKTVDQNQALRDT